MTKEEQNLMCDKLNAARELESRIHRIEEILEGIGNSSSLIISKSSTKETVVVLGAVNACYEVNWLREGLQLVADRIKKEYDAL